MNFPLGSRFSAVFYAKGVVPNPIDIRFQRVSGLSATIETTSVNEGGQNLYSHKFPKQVGHGNLTLERGFVVGSRLNSEFNDAMNLFKFQPSNVLITLLDAAAVSLAAWLFVKAFPVRWATTDLSAMDEKLVIDTLELSYASMLPIQM
jgi:phage tail-like protein